MIAWATNPYGYPDPNQQVQQSPQPPNQGHGQGGHY